MKKLLLILFLAAIPASWAGYRLVSSRSFQLCGGLVYRVDSRDKQVFLTFDDGPTDRTLRVLELLGELEVKATFFVTGRQLQANAEIGRLIVEQGHQLGNHSYSHRRMVMRSPGFIRREVQKTNELIRQAGHTGPILFRPPYGNKLLMLPCYLRRQQIPTIMWDVAPDTGPLRQSSPEEITRHVMQHVRPGSIILLHVMYPGQNNSMQAIRPVVEALREEGWTFGELRIKN